MNGGLSAVLLLLALLFGALGLALSVIVVWVVVFVAGTIGALLRRLT